MIGDFFLPGKLPRARSFVQKIRQVYVKQLLARSGQGDDFAALQGSQGTRQMFLMGMPRLAKIIDHDVQCSQEGIHIDHQLAPFLTNGFDKLTVRGG
jgi:hypothetical protein